MTPARRPAAPRPARWATSFAVILATGALLTACTSSSSTASTTSTTAATSTASTTSTTAATSTTTTVPGAGSTTTTSGTAVRNLPATAQVKSDLRAAYLAMAQLPASEVVGPLPGTVYYAYDPQTSTYWAMATFGPTSTPSEKTGIAMQDGGNQGFYKMASGASWSAQPGGIPPYCAEAPYFPAGVLQAWGITKPASLTC
jgi:hypothetical protein